MRKLLAILDNGTHSLAERQRDRDNKRIIRQLEALYALPSYGEETVTIERCPGS